MPSPRAVQVDPSHLAMLRASTPPADSKPPAAIRAGPLPSSKAVSATAPPPTPGLAPNDGIQPGSHPLDSDRIRSATAVVPAGPDKAATTLPLRGFAPCGGCAPATAETRRPVAP